MSKENTKTIGPFIKWAGGKTQLLDELVEKIPKDNKLKYIEPFLGGGALFFYSVQNNLFDEYILNDINPKLINLYIQIRDNIDPFLETLSELKDSYLELSMESRKDFFYKVRDTFNDDAASDLISAVSFVFLNKTCFNGLYRENSRGKFNVPIGSYKNPSIFDEGHLRDVSALLNKKNSNGEPIVKLICGDYKNVEKYIDSNSFVYFDPPYRPITLNGFTSYNKSGFNDTTQIELGNFYRELDKRKAKLLLSNSDPKNYDVEDSFFDDLYKDFQIDRIHARRAINSKGNARGKVTELLISNY